MIGKKTAMMKTKKHDDIVVKINNHQWTIQFVSRDDPSLIKDNGILCEGVSRLYERKISIRDDCTPDLTEQLLVHELTHAFLDETDISQPREEYNEEEVATFNELNADAIVETANTVKKFFITSVWKGDSTVDEDK